MRRRGASRSARRLCLRRNEELVSNKHKAQRSGFVLERKKEIADVQLSRPLRKPRKRNGASFF